LKHIALSGFMGTGKSSVAPILAKMMGRPWIDLDRYIEQSAQRSLSQIFQEEGEQGFREREQEALLLLLETKPSLFALGGGTLLSKSLREQLRKRACLINLSAEPETLRRRLSGAAEARPLLEQDFERLLEERASVYAEADLLIETDGKTPELLAVEILDLLEAGSWGC